MNRQVRERERERERERDRETERQRDRETERETGIRLTERTMKLIPDTRRGIAKGTISYT